MDSSTIPQPNQTFSMDSPAAGESLDFPIAVGTAGKVSSVAVAAVEVLAGDVQLRLHGTSD